MLTWRINKLIKDVFDFSMEKELQIFERHVAEHGLKHSKKREYVVQAFLRTQKHVSAEDLLHQIKKERSDIGYTTVYRTQPGRGFEEAAALIGADYAGVLVRDGSAPYRQFDAAHHQTCLAHLARALS